MSKTKKRKGVSAGISKLADDGLIEVVIASELPADHEVHRFSEENAHYLEAYIEKYLKEGKERKDRYVVNNQLGSTITCFFPPPRLGNIRHCLRSLIIKEGADAQLRQRLEFLIEQRLRTLPDELPSLMQKATQRGLDEMIFSLCNEILDKADIRLKRNVFLANGNSEKMEMEGGLVRRSLSKPQGGDRRSDSGYYSSEEDCVRLARAAENTIPLWKEITIFFEKEDYDSACTTYVNSAEKFKRLSKGCPPIPSTLLKDVYTRKEVRKRNYSPQAFALKHAHGAERISGKPSYESLRKAYLKGLKFTAETSREAG
jgi:hypothetical protein